MRAATADELYRTKGVVPLAFAEAEAEAARQGLPPPTRENSTKLGDTWWLFNGVAGRLTLEPLRASAGPPSIVFMGDGLSLVKARLEKRSTRVTAGAVAAGTGLAAPKPTIEWRSPPADRVRRRAGARLRAQRRGDRRTRRRGASEAAASRA